MQTPRPRAALFLAALLCACGGGKATPSDAQPEVDAPPQQDAPPQPDAPPEPDAAPDAPPDAPPDAAGFDCSAQPTFPIAYNTLTGFSNSEDFAFDKFGNLVSTQTGNLTRQPKDGPPELFVPNIGSTAGTRYLPDGFLVVANVSEDSLVKVSPAGSQVTLLAGFSYPNGVEVDLDGFAYVAEQSGGRVRQVDGNTGEFTIIATGLNSPNGLSFSPDYQTLYVGSFGGGTVHKITRDGLGGWLPPELLGSTSGHTGGGLDGVTVDVCGYVYVTVFGPGEIWRFAPEGGPPEHVVTLPSSWIPNLHWGAGRGGWDEDKLYVIERGSGRVFELLLTIPEKVRVYPP